MNLLTNSSLKCYRRCQRLYYLRYMLGYRAAVEDEALRIGSLIHLGREAWFNGIIAGLRGDELLAFALAAMAGESDPFDRARAEALMIGYHARWEGEALEILAVEVEFRAPMINPATGKESRTWTLGGKLDGIVCQDGRKLIDELKSSSEDVSAGSSYQKRLRMDGQVSMYFRGAHALGYDVEGCLYDVIGKPALRPLKATPIESRKFTKDGKLYAAQRDADESPESFKARVMESIAENPEKYFSRFEVARLQTEIDEHAQDIWQTAQSIRNSILRNVWPRNPDSCQMYNRDCTFFGPCTGEASLDDREKFTQVEQVHSELSATPIFDNSVVMDRY